MERSQARSRQLALAIAVLGVAALAAAIFVFGRDPPAEADPSSADDRAADNLEPTLDVDERPDAPGPDKAEYLGPLVSECACEVHPSEEEVAIALDFTLMSAPEIGGVIEAVEPREGNQAAGPLLDCITESAFSMALSPASSRGSTRISFHASTSQCDEYLAEAAKAGRETGAEARR